MNQDQIKELKDIHSRLGILIEELKEDNKLFFTPYPKKRTHVSQENVNKRKSIL